jgi:beta-lactamase superfamily II metal-dependent hydrolase
LSGYFILIIQKIQIKTSLLAILIYFNCCGISSAAAIYHWDEAHLHVGESATIEGIITYTNNIGNVCFLNFDPNFEKYVSIVIRREYFVLFPKKPQAYYYLKKVRVHGKITSYKGKAEIMIYDPRQIEVVGSYERHFPSQRCECRYPDRLEITAINIGQGDATLIASPTKLMLIDAGESQWYSHADAMKIDAVIKEKYGPNCNCLDDVLISHFHLDHLGYVYFPENQNHEPLNANLEVLQLGDSPYRPIGYGGLGYLVLEKGYHIKRMLVRDYKKHNPNKSPDDGGSKTFRNWRILLESKEGKVLFNPEVVTLGSHQVELGDIEQIPVKVDVVAVDGATPSFPDGCDPGKFFGGSGFAIRGDNQENQTPPSENDLCVSVVISYGDFQMFVGGDLSGENYVTEFGYRYHDMETCLTSDLAIMGTYADTIEVLRANHHGSSHSTNEAFLKFISPIVTIFSVGDHNTYGHVSLDVIDRAVRYSKKVYLTECGDTIESKSDADAKRIVVVDGEYPNELEEDESGDPNIEIVVFDNGHRFSVDGNPYLSR